MTRLYACIAAVLGVFAVCAAASVALEIYRPDGFNVETLNRIFAMGGGILVVLYGIIQSVVNGQKLEEIKKETIQVAKAANIAAEESTKTNRK